MRAFRAVFLLFVCSATALPSFKGRAGVEHYGGGDSVSQSNFYGDLSYELSPAHSLRLYQSVSHPYEIDEVGGRELEFADTVAYYYYRSPIEWQKIKFGMRVGATLPVSPGSQKDGNLTKTSLQLSATRKFFNSKVTASYRPFVRYAFNRYSTTPDGIPVNHWGFGHTVLLRYDPINKLDVTAALSGAFSYKEKSAFASSSGPPSGSYEYDLSLGYQAHQSVSLRVGYLQSDGFIKEGRYEINFYDPHHSRYYFAVALSY